MASRGSLDGALDLSFSATPFADGLIGNGGFAPTHTVPNVSNGTYGNASSWIGGSYVGLSWGNVGRTIQSIAFGRDNAGALTDRSDGTYTLQYTTADLTALPLPGSGVTAGVVGAAADGAGWVTAGTINLTGSATRNRFDLAYSLSGVTGLRLIAPNGAAIDEFEAYNSRLTAGTRSANLVITPSAGITVGWDGNDGVNFSAADPAVVPANLALGATAISSSDLGPQLGIPHHRALNLNDGLYGNNKSWISGTADTVSPFGGVTFTGGARHVSGVAWGRDNGNSVGDAPNQQFTDRAAGLYTLQSLNPNDNTTWETLGTFNYLGNDDATTGGGFTSWLRHQYSIATAGGALRSAGIRVIVPPGGFGSNAIDELEVQGSTMTWTNAAATGKWNLNGEANFSGAADGKFLAEDSVRFGNTGAGTVTLEGSLNAGTVTVDASSNYTFAGAGSITGAARLTKSGTGTLTIAGAHTFSGPTNVDGGTLVLDFAGAESPTTNILGNTALTLSGTTLTVAGKAGAVNSQQFSGTTLRAGAANIAVVSGGATSLAVNLGAITRNVGATAVLTLPTGNESAANGIISSSGAAGTILADGGVAFATIGNSDWAAQSAGGTNITGLATLGGYTGSTASALTGNADVSSGVDTSLAASTSVTSLRFNQNEGRTISIAGGQTLTTGGILVTPTVATAGSAINGGTLSGPAGKDLVVFQNSPVAFIVGSVIADNTTATGLTKVGNGSLALTAQNSFTGNIQVSGGSLVVSGGSNGTLNGLGANVAGRTLNVAQGATLISTTTDSVDFSSTTQNLIAFRVAGVWENNPLNTAGTGFQRVDNLTLQGGTVNDRGQHGGSFGGILMAGNVTVSGSAASTYNQLGAGSGLGLLATTFDVQDVTGDAAADFTVNGITRNSAVGAGSLQKRGAGTMVITGQTLHTGSTTVTEGILSLQGGSSGALPNVWIGTGAKLSADVASGNNRHDLTGNLTLAGGTLGGNANVSDTNTGQFFLSNAGQQVVVHGDVQSVIAAETHVSGTHIFNVADGASAVDLLVTGKLSHQHLSAWGGIVKTGNGTMHLASSMDGTNSAGVNGIYGLGGIELAGGTLIFSGSLGYSGNAGGTAPASRGYYNADFSANSTLKWDAGNTMDVSVNGNLRIRDGVTASFDTNGNNVTFATPIVIQTGTGGLSKLGNGTLTLAAANTYAGATAVGAGTLNVTGSLGNTAASVASGASLAGEGSIGATGSLTLNGGSTMRVDGSTAGAFSVGGNLTLNGTVNVAASGTPAVVGLGQTIRVLNYSGTLTGSEANLATTEFRNPVFSTATANQVNLTFDTKALTWSGGSAAWNINATSNWNAGTDTFFQGDAVTFDDSGATKAVALNAAVAPGSVTFNNSTGNDYSFTGTGGIASSITKNGTGSVILSTANPLTGPTTINAGAIRFTKQVALYNNTPSSWTATNLVVASGATAVFSVGGTGEFTSANIDTLKGLGTASGGFKSGSFLGLDTTNASGGVFNYATAIGNTNGGSNIVGLTKSGAGTLALSGASTYTGPTTVNGGTLSLQNAAASTLFSVSVASGATLSTDVASGVNQRDLGGNLTLAGGTLGGNANISDSAKGQFFLSNAGQQVIVSGNTQSTIAAEVHVAGTHTFNVADGTAPVDLLVTGKLSHWHGAAWGGIQKTGNGTMYLANSMNGTNSAGATGVFGLGGIELGGGTLIFSGSTGYSALAPASKVGYYLADFSASSTLKWDAGNTMDVSVNNNLRIRDGVNATFDTNGNNVTFATSIVNGTTGSGALSKAGNGTLTLAAANSLSGGTNVNAGTLLVSGTIGGGPITVNGGLLSLQNAAVSTLSSVTIGNGGTLSADVASGVNQRNLVGNLTLTGGTLAANSNVSDLNLGQFFLSGAGQQVIVSGDNPSTISAEMHMNGTHVFNVADGAAPVDLLVTGKLSHQHLVAWGGIQKTGNGTMHLASSMDGANSAGTPGIFGLGGIEIAGGTLIFSGSTGYSAFTPGNKVGYYLVDFSGTSTLKWDAGNTMDISVNNNLRIRDGVNATLDTNGNDVVLSAAVVNGTTGTGALTKAGNGKLTLVANNTYSGGTTVNGGTLQLGNGGASGSVAGNIVNNGTVVIKRGGDFTYPDVISGSGGFVQDGFIVRLANPQTYAGPTSVSAGAFLVMPTGVDQGIAATSVVTVAAGGNFDFSSRALTIAGLNGGGNVYSFNTAAGSLTLDVASGQTHDFTGALGGSFPNFAVSKSGPGTQIISGAATHTGATSVNGGTLVVNGAISGSTTTVNNGGTLGGSGTTGPVNVLAGGTIAPGNSPGLLTTGALALNTGGALSMEINGMSAYDQLAVNGTVSLGGGTLSLSGSYLTTPAVTGDLFFLILNDGADAVTGIFAGVPDGGHVYASGGQDFILSYFANSGTAAFTGGNDVALMAVPEPGSAVLLLGGLGALVGLRRRKTS